MLKPGERIGDWIVVDVLGEGGMGAVFRCKNALSDRIEAAVKVVKPHSLENEMERFLREVESLDSLRHQAVVRVKGWGKDSERGFLWLAMDLVTGEDLEKRLAKGPLSLEEARRIFAVVADALRHAHGHGIFHRDIKPANIILAADGSPRIVDFGIAVQKGRTRLTAMGTIPGTPAYMAPEIFAGEARPDPIKVDVYALGQVLLEAVTGHHAYPDEDDTELSTGQKLVSLMGQKLRAEPLDPGPDYPEELRAIIRSSTAPEPPDRMPDMGAFVAGLTGVPQTAGQPGGNRGDSTFGLEIDGIPKVPQTEWVQSKKSDPKAVGGKSDPKAVGGKSDPKAVGGKSDPKALAAAAPPAGPPSGSVSTEAPRGGGGAKIAIAGVAGLAGAGAVVLLLAVVLVVLGGGAIGAWMLWPQGRDSSDTGGGYVGDGAAVRDVQVAVTGLAEGTPFDVTIDDLSADAAEGMTWQFESVVTGSRYVKVTAGPGCHAVTDEPCGVCCSCNEAMVDVVEGDEPQTVLIHVGAPPKAGPRAVRIQAPLVADGWSTFVDLGGATGPKGTRVDSRTKDYPVVEPGDYEARIEAGKCPVTAQGCTNDDNCPEGCQSWTGVITVPCGTDTYVHTIDLPTPSGKPPKASESSTACRTSCPSGAYTGGTLYAGTRVKVTGINEEDAYCGYPGIVGLTGTIADELHSNDGCWLGGGLNGDDGVYYYFYKAAVKKIEGGGSVAPSTSDAFGDGRYVTTALSSGSSVRIVDVHPDDAYYGDAGALIGMRCTTSSDLYATDTGWFGGSIYCPDIGSDLYFYKVALAP